MKTTNYYFKTYQGMTDWLSEPNNEVRVKYGYIVSRTSSGGYLVTPSKLNRVVAEECMASVV